MAGRMEGTSETEVYILTRDGKEIFRGTRNECQKTLAALCLTPEEAIFLVGGYRIEPRKEKP